MQWSNPFSFRQEAGRGQFWLTYLALCFAMLLHPFPVEPHDVVRKTVVGEFSAWYFTPAEPVTAMSWVYFGLSVLCAALFLWIFAAVIVQRLNRLGIRWQWAPGWFAGFFAAIMLGTATPASHPALSVLDVLAFVLFVPVVLVGIFGMFQIMLLPGHKDRRDSMPDNDMRKPAM